MVLFWLKESYKSIGRAKSSFILTLISLTLAVLLIEASIITLQLSSLFQKNLKNNININVFIKDPFDVKDVPKFESDLKSSKYVTSVNFVSKDEAAKTFIRETGQDFRDILDYNPLPASFVVKLNADVVTKDSLNSAVNSLSKFNWVDEVVFKNSFVYQVLSYLDTGKKYLFIITGILILIAVYLVYSTIRLITVARMRELETMKLVGAKLSMIKLPIIFNGILAGIIASLIAVILYYIVFMQIRQYYTIEKFILENMYFYIITILGIGPVLCSLVTLFSLRKLTLKI